MIRGVTLLISVAALSKSARCSLYLSHRVRCRANLARIRQSRADSGLGVQVKQLETFKLFPLFSAMGGGGTEVPLS